MEIRLIKDRNGSTVLRTTQDDEVSKCAELVFRALAETKGDTVVVRAGQRPFLDAPAGRVFLARQPLTNAAVDSLVGRLFPASLRDQLDRDGTAHYSRPAHSDVKGEQFTVDAARQRDGWSLEIGRAATVQNDEIDELAATWERRGLASARPRVRGVFAFQRAEDLELPSEDELWPNAEKAAPRIARRA